jgi:hypothetical protein
MRGALVKRGDPIPLMRRYFGRFSVDSLGNFCYRKSCWLFTERPDDRTEKAEEATRCLGVLVARSMRDEFPTEAAALFPERATGGLILTAHAVPAPGMKARVVGVPDALTFIEGEWLRASAGYPYPREHWQPPSSRTFRLPRALKHRSGFSFVSVDLSAATDGLKLDALEAVIDGWVDGGLLLPSERATALATLGVEPLPLWRHGAEEKRGRRGSPMGTPLSFPVLCTVNAWACQAFEFSIVHGDDAVGLCSTRLTSGELEDYERIISSVGGELNRSKTYISQRAWLACELMGGQDPVIPKDKRSCVLFAPPVPSCELAAPVPCDPRLDVVGKRRLERVMRARFPWIVKDPRLHLPPAVGGLGYTGRGLKVGVGIRRRLAAAVSRGADWRIAESFLGTAAWKEKGFFPRPLVFAPTAQAERIKSQRWAEDALPLCERGGVGETVRAESLVVKRGEWERSHYFHWNAEMLARRSDAGRPRKNQTRSLFRKGRGVPAIAPLSVRHGVASLERFAASLRNLPVQVPQFVADEVRGGTAPPT